MQVLLNLIVIVTLINVHILFGSGWFCTKQKFIE